VFKDSDQILSTPVTYLKQEVGSVSGDAHRKPDTEKNVCIVIIFSSKRLVFLFMIGVLKAYLHVVC